MNITRLSFMFVAGLLTLSCQRAQLDPDDLVIGPQPGIRLPIGHVSMTMEDVLPVGNGLSIQGDGTYQFVMNLDSIINFDVSDLVTYPSQTNVNTSFKMGLIEVPNVSASQGISLGTISSYVTNPSNFDSLLTASHGTNSVFPAVPTQNPGNVASVSLSNFSQASFDSGTLDMTLVNDYPVTVSLTVALKNSGGSTVASYTFSNVLAGDSSTQSSSLAGVTMTNPLDVEITNFTSPGAGTPGVPSSYVYIDTSDVLSLNIEGQNMLIYSGQAQVTTQTVVDDVQQVDLNLSGTGIELEEIKFATGAINVSVNSSLPEALSIALSLPSSNPGGTPVQTTISVPASGTSSGSLNLAQAVVDLTQDILQPFNQFPVHYQATIQSSGQVVAIDSSQGVTVNMTIGTIDHEHVKGYFGSDTLSIPSDTVDLPVDLLNELGGTISFTEPSVTFAVNNGVGLPISVALDMNSYYQGQGTSLNAQEFIMPHPNMNQMGVQIVDSVVIDKNNSNIVPFLTMPKSEIAYGGQAIWNKDTTVTGRENFAMATSSLMADVLFDLPFIFTASGLSWVDSVEVNLSNDIIDSATATLFVNTTSWLPLDAQLTLAAYDSVGVMTYQTQVVLLQSGTVNPGTGIVSAPGIAVNAITMDALDYDAFTRASVLEITATMESSQQGAVPVKLLTHSAVEVALGLEIKIQ